MEMIQTMQHRRRQGELQRVGDLTGSNATCLTYAGQRAGLLSVIGTDLLCMADTGSGQLFQEPMLCSLKQRC